MNVKSYLTHEPIDLAAFLGRAHHRSAGAVVLFSGEVRDHNQGRAVVSLEYEAHAPLAEKTMAAICDEARRRYELYHVDCLHRLGPVPVGESAVVVVTAAAHRSEAFAANRQVIDRIKAEVPIWKKEYFADGSSEWSRGCRHGEVADVSLVQGDPAASTPANAGPGAP